MKQTLLLNDDLETVRPTLKDVTSGGVAVRESEDHAGCNCDRWGHPCPGCSKSKSQTEGNASISATNQTRDK